MGAPGMPVPHVGQICFNFIKCLGKNVQNNRLVHTFLRLASPRLENPVSTAGYDDIHNQHNPRTTILAFITSLNFVNPDNVVTIVGESRAVTIPISSFKLD